MSTTTTTTYKLAVASIIWFTVQLRLKDDGRDRFFNFQLQADRVTQAELTDELDQYKDRPVSELLKLHVSSWRDQQLVLDNSSGQPADFSLDAFDAMLSVPGAAGVIFTAYLQACGAKGKAGN